MHNLKAENYVSFEDLSPRYSLSDSSQGLFQRVKGGARIYRSFAEKKTKQNKKHIVEHQRITANNLKNPDISS